MYRVVFCPNNSLLEEAETLAKEWDMPIQIGDSGRTESLDFDRSVVSTIAIPVEHHFEFNIEYDEVTVGGNYRINYVNDFVECKEVKLFVHKGENSWELTTFLRDDHALVTSVIPNSPGVYTLKAYQGDRLLASDEFGVDGE